MSARESGPMPVRVRVRAALARVVATPLMALIPLAMGAWGCAEEAPETHPVLEEAVAVILPEPAALGAVVSDTAYGWTGPGGRPFEVTRRTPGGGSRLHRQVGTKTFALPLRTAEPTLSQYPCTSCHEGSTVTGGRTDRAHQNIRPVHPAQTGAACATCHVSTVVERLVLPGGETATLDQAYRLCAQCHVSQVNAWAGGGHGKRLDGWHGRRVVMNCADCHDPHRPGLEPRVPYPGPRPPRTARGAP